MGKAIFKKIGVFEKNRRPDWVSDRKRRRRRKKIKVFRRFWLFDVGWGQGFGGLNLVLLAWCGLGTTVFRHFLVWCYSFLRFSWWKTLGLMTATSVPEVLLGIWFCILLWMWISAKTRFAKHLGQCFWAFGGLFLVLLAWCGVGATGFVHCPVLISLFLVVGFCDFRFWESRFWTSNRTSCIQLCSGTLQFWGLVFRNNFGFENLCAFYLVVF